MNMFEVESKTYTGLLLIAGEGAGLLGGVFTTGEVIYSGAADCVAASADITVAD